MFENSTHAPDRSEIISHITEFYLDLNLIDVVYDVVATDDITENIPLNPRGEITDSVWMQSSLKKFGQDTAIEVIPTVDGRFFLDDGHTRLVAARALGWKQLRAKYPQWFDGIPVAVPDRHRMLFHMLASNVRRNISHSKRGRAYIKLITQDFVTVESLAQTMGELVTDVQDCINLASAPDSVQRRVDSGEMSWTAFREYRKKSAAVQAAIAVSNDPKDFQVRGLRKKAHEIRTGQPAPATMSVIEEVLEENKVNPLIANFKAAAQAVMANWYQLSDEQRREVLYTLGSLSDLMENQ